MYLISKLLLIVCVLFAWQARADENNHAAHPGLKTPVNIDVWQWLLALIMVLALFLAIVWLLRKTNSFSLINKGQLSIAAALSLGVREKIILVNVGQKQLLLGVTPGRIDKLLELEGEQRLYQNAASQATQGTFAEKLQQFIKDKPHD